MQAPQGGKLESIKNLGAISSDVVASKQRCSSARYEMERLLAWLRGTADAIVKQRETEVLQKQKQEQYAGLIKQRQQEKEEAERKVDERTESRLKAATPSVMRRMTNEANKTNSGENKTNQGTARPNNNLPHSPKSSFASLNPQRTFVPNQNQSSRPPYSGSTSNTRPPYSGAPGARPPYPPRDGQRSPYPPRDASRPGFAGPRPMGPRPAGTGPRPAGSGGAARPIGNIKPTEKFVPKTDTFSGKKKVKTFDGAEKPTMDKRTLLRRGYVEEQEIEERMLTRIFKTKKAKENAGTSNREQSNVIIIHTNTLTVKTLSEKIGKPVTEIIKQLMVLGNMCTINSTIDFETAALVAMEFGFELELHADKTFEEKLGDVHKKTAGDEGKLEPRPPVVTVLGHVDHGKTSLLDAIRKTNVTAREHGGITQHIGAYRVKHNDKKITFIDTPGHAAFEKMRARGAQITDIAILLVAGDDGVMPQTAEAIKHIQKHKLPMIVVVNKMDKKEANIDRVKEQLAAHEVLTEEWGGDAILVPVSAVSGMGIDKLLEMILLVADMNEYKANPNKEAQGSIIDARRDPAKGAVVTVLVQSGTLKVGDTLLAGTTYGKVRSMTDEHGKKVTKAKPSTPVSVLGFSEVPKAGDACYVVDEKLTKQVVLERKTKERVKQTRAGTKVAADIDAIARLDESAKKQLNVIIKGDVSGSVEAIIQSVKNITSDEVNINVISSGVGVVNDNDVALAEMAGARLIAFHVKTSPTAAAMAKKQKVQIHQFNVIYQIFDFITEQMVRIFSPKFVEIYHGRAEIRAVFKSSALGLIAGCMVTDGKIIRNTKIKLHRGGELLGEYKMESLKIKKDDMKEVAQGFECGIKLEGNVEVRIGDVLECVGQEQQPIIYGGKKYEF